MLKMIFKSHVSQAGSTWHTEITGIVRIVRLSVDELSWVWFISSLLMRQPRLRRVDSLGQDLTRSKWLGGCWRPSLVLCWCICCLSVSLCPAYGLSTSLSSPGRTVPLSFHLGTMYYALWVTRFETAPLCGVAVKFALVPWTSWDSEQRSGHRSRQTKDNNVKLL